MTGVVLGKRERTTARNRALVVTAARRVLAELGYERATVRDIIRATGLSVGTFYEYFRDKDDAFYAAIREVEADLVHAFRVARSERQQSLEERVFDANLIFFQFVCDNPEYFAVMERAMLGGGGTVQDGLTKTILRLHEDFMGDLAHAPLARADTDAFLAAIVGAGFALAKRMLGRASPDPAATARLYTTLVLQLLAPEQSDTKARRRKVTR